jgi:hypothetical protein
MLYTTHYYVSSSAEMRLADAAAYSVTSTQSAAKVLFTLYLNLWNFPHYWIYLFFRQ